jgi:hypothetical protein
MNLRANRNSSSAQFRFFLESNSRAEMKEEFPENPMGFDPQERLAKSDEASNV